MELKLENGRDGAARYQGLKRVGGLEEIRQRVCMKLCAKKGGFLPFPEFGSRLYTLSGVKPSHRENAAKQFVAEALSGETELTLESVSVGAVNEEGVCVAVTLIYKGNEKFVVEATI